jgi:protein-L-isoaspartate(D-aspartate) O-methyltransferase
VLDVGSGSGYLTLAFAYMTDGEGQVVGIEHVPQLVEVSKRNITKSHKNMLSG